MKSVRDIVDELLEAKLPSIKKSHVSAHKTTDDVIKSVRQALRGKAGVGVSGLRIYTSDGDTLCSDCTKDNWQQIVKATKNMDRSGWGIIGVDHDMNCDDEDQCCHCNKKLGEDVAEAKFPSLPPKSTGISLKQVDDESWPGTVMIEYPDGSHDPTDFLAVIDGKQLVVEPPNGNPCGFAAQDIISITPDGKGGLKVKVRTNAKKLADSVIEAMFPTVTKAVHHTDLSEMIAVLKELCRDLHDFAKDNSLSPVSADGWEKSLRGTADIDYFFQKHPQHLHELKEKYNKVSGALAVIHMEIRRNGLPTDNPPDPSPTPTPSDINWKKLLGYPDFERSWQGALGYHWDEV